MLNTNVIKKHLLSLIWLVVTAFAANAQLSSNSPVCQGQDIELVVTINGDQYDWYGPAGFLSTTTTNKLIIPSSSASDQGVYTVDVFVGGVKSGFSTNVTVVDTPPPPQLSGEMKYCKGETVQVFTDNGDTYDVSWVGPNNYTSNTNDLIINNVGTDLNGQFFVEYQNSGCPSSVISFTLDVGVEPDRPTISGGTTFCLGSEIKLTASSVSSTDSMVWILPTGSILQTNPLVVSNAVLANRGVYQVSAYSGICKSQPNNVNIQLIAPPDKPVIDNKFEFCASDNGAVGVVKMANPGFTEWRNPSGGTVQSDSLRFNSFKVSDNGIYEVAYHNGTCFGESRQFEIKVNEVPVTPTVSSPNPNICAGDTLYLDGDIVNDYQLNWVSPSGRKYSGNDWVVPNVDYSYDGTFKVYGINKGCTGDTATFNVGIFFTPVIDSVEINNPICVGDEMKGYTVSNGSTNAQVNWSDNLGGASSLDTIRYGNIAFQPGMQVYVTVSEGSCESKVDTIDVITVRPITNLNITSNQPICEYDDLTLEVGTYDYATYEWRAPALRGDTRDTIITEAGLNRNGFYIATVTNLCGTEKDTLEVVINPIPRHTIESSDSTVCELEEQVDLEVTPEYTAYEWTTGETTKDIVTQFAGTYAVRAWNEFGCTSIATYELGELCAPEIYAPNAFTPDGDGINDKFYIVGQNLEGFHLEIFNRQSEKVFDTKNPFEGWDGTHLGERLGPAPFFYRVTYYTIYKGTIKAEETIGDFLLIW